MTLEDFSDAAEDLVADDHVSSFPVFGTLGHFELIARLLAFIFPHDVVGGGRGVYGMYSCSWGYGELSGRCDWTRN